jgi:hypothetical protein
MKIYDELWDLPEQNKSKIIKNIIYNKNYSIISNEKFVIEDSCNIIETVKPIYFLRSYNRDEEFHGLSVKNPEVSDGLYWLLSNSSFPSTKHHVGVIFTKATIGISIFFNKKPNNDFLKAFGSFIPSHCICNKDLYLETKTPGFYRNDFSFKNKKCGALESLNYKNDLYVYNFMYNSCELDQSDLQDIIFLSEKYDDPVYKKNPDKFINNIGGGYLTKELFKKQFFDHFKLFFNN